MPSNPAMTLELNKMIHAKLAVRRSRLQEIVGPDRGAPHMGDRRIIESKPLLWMLKVAPKDVGKAVRIRH
jgi:hypothetical protein